MSTKRKYPDMKALAAAFSSGELSRKHYKLVLDNDSSWLKYIGPLPDGIKAGTDQAYVFIDEKNEECADWFEGNGYSDLPAACEAAGIPTEWC